MSAELVTNGIKQALLIAFQIVGPLLSISLGAYMLFTLTRKFIRNFIHHSFENVILKLLLMSIGAFLIYWGITNF